MTAAAESRTVPSTTVCAESLARGMAMARMPQMKVAWHFVIRIKLPDRQKETETLAIQQRKSVEKHELLM